jgi:hypothetical protein
LYCPRCRCEFEGWTSKCPSCGIPLVRELAPEPAVVAHSVSYDALVELVCEHGGQFKIELSTTDIGFEKKLGFPYRGYGFAWAKRMQSASNLLSVDLRTSEIGKQKKWSFPYFGYGYAWAKRMHGDIAGNQVFLKTDKVFTERKRRFPYLGYGYAWSQQMSGECGAGLGVHLLITDIGRKREWRFPYQGYGLAWENKGVLTLSLDA